MFHAFLSLLVKWRNITSKIINIEMYHHVQWEPSWIFRLSYPSSVACLVARMQSTAIVPVTAALRLHQQKNYFERRHLQSRQEVALMVS